MMAQAGIAENVKSTISFSLNSILWVTKMHEKLQRSISKAEMAIRDALWAIEDMGPSRKLRSAKAHLKEADRLVKEYLDVQ